MNSHALRNVYLHPDKFNQDIMRTLRLSFLSSKTLIDNGGASFAMKQDFKSPVDEQSERMSFDFLMQTLEENLNNLKPREHYQAVIEDPKQIETVSDYNLRNMHTI